MALLGAAPKGDRRRRLAQRGADRTAWRREAGHRIALERARSSRRCRPRSPPDRTARRERWSRSAAAGQQADQGHDREGSLCVLRDAHGYRLRRRVQGSGSEAARRRPHLHDRCTAGAGLEARPGSAGPEASGQRPCQESGLLLGPPAGPPRSRPPSLPPTLWPSSILPDEALAPPGRLWLRPFRYSRAPVSRRDRAPAPGPGAPRRRAASGWRPGRSGGVAIAPLGSHVQHGHRLARAPAGGAAPRW